MGELKIGRMCMGPVQTNCYFVYDDETKKAVVFDVPCDGEGIYNGLKGKGLTVAGICLTHGHFDHIMGCNELREKALAKLYALEPEDELCRNAYLNASESIRRPYTTEPDVLLVDGEEFDAAGIHFKVYATPGHTIGSCCYYIESEKWLFSGDTLFCESIGRSDLPTGSGEQIMTSVKKIVDTFEDDVKVYPGHGESTTIGYEKEYNPFVSYA